MKVFLAPLTLEFILHINNLLTVRNRYPQEGEEVDIRQNRAVYSMLGGTHYIFLKNIWVYKEWVGGRGKNINNKDENILPGP